MYATREDILNIADTQFEEVSVPEWGGITVRLRSLAGVERDELEASMVEGKGRDVSVNLSNLRAKMVARSAVDENGKRIFTDADIVLLGQKNAAALDRIFAVARRLSGMNEQDVQELTKN